MNLQRSVGGSTAYFLGTISASGSRLYFPVLYLLKEPLPSLIIVLVGLILALWGSGRAVRQRQARSGFKRYLHEHFTEFAIITVFLVIYWSYSIHSTLNIGIRHLMPTIPLMYMALAAGMWRKWITKMNVAGGRLGARHRVLRGTRRRHLLAQVFGAVRAPALARVRRVFRRALLHLVLHRGRRRRVGRLSLC